MFGVKLVLAKLEVLQAKLERIDAALVVRDPGNARSVEAYDGLRKQVAASMRERRAHLVQLMQLSDALDRDASKETLAALSEEWCLQTGLRRWTDLGPPEFFETAEGDGQLVEVLAPAWVDVSDPLSPVLIRQGMARAGGSPEPDVPTAVPRTEGLETAASTVPASASGPHGSDLGEDQSAGVDEEEQS